MRSSYFNTHRQIKLFTKSIMMTTISITNQKGGVGKTTTAVNLSAGLARRGFRVLLVDSDPQCNASTHLGIKGEADTLTLDDLYYQPELQAAEIIQPARGFDLLPAGEALAYAEQKLAGVPGREMILSEKLANVSTHYDFCIIDCPPNLGFLTINAYTASGGLIITVKPEYFALEGLKQIHSILGFIRKRLNPDLNILGYVITDFDARKNQHKAIRKAMGRTFNGKVFDTTIRTNARLSDCSSAGSSIFEFAPNTYGAIDYLNLAKELEVRHGQA
jgi:chromosome partitioning protein